jgi:hypothetical protein
MRPRKISWWEPSWSHRPRSAQDFLKSYPVVLRGVFWSYPAGAAVIALFLWANPGTPLPMPLWRLLFLPLIFVPVLLLQNAVLWLVPPQCSVTPRRFAYSHGQSGFSIPSDRILDAQIDTSNPHRPLLRLHYLSRRKKERELVIGLGPGVDLIRLDNVLTALLQHLPATSPAPSAQ